MSNCKKIRKTAVRLVLVAVFFGFLFFLAYPNIGSAQSINKQQAASLATQLELLKKLVEGLKNALRHNSLAQVSSSCSSGLIALLGDGCHFMYTNSASQSVYCDGAMTKSAKEGDTATTAGCSSGGTASTTGSPPSPPTGVSATLTNSGKDVTLTWSAVSNATEHKVYRSGTFMVSYGSSVISHIDYSPPANTYNYYVIACNSYGCSGNSNTATVTVTGGSTAPSFPPSGLTAVYNSSSNSITLNWVDNSTNETEFKIWRRPSAGSWAFLNAVTVGNTFTDSAPASGSYDYQVQACNTSGCSPDSNIATVSASNVSTTSSCSTALKTLLGDGCHFMYTNSISQSIYCDGAMTKSAKEGDTATTAGCSSSTGGTTGTIPSTPSGLSAVFNATGNYVALTWTDTATNEDSFKIWRRPSGGSWSFLSTVGIGASGSSVTYSDYSIPSAGSYDYQVQACNTSGCSPDSNVATVSASGASTGGTTTSTCSAALKTLLGDGCHFMYTNSASQSVYCDGAMTKSAKDGDTAATAGCSSGTTTTTTSSNWVQKTWNFKDGQTTTSSILNRTDSEYANYLAPIQAQCLTINKSQFGWKPNSGDSSAGNWQNFGIPDCSGTATTQTTTSSSTCSAALKTLLGDGCHFMYTNSASQSVYCDGAMTKSAKDGDTAATAGCSSGTTTTTTGSCPSGYHSMGGYSTATGSTGGYCMSDTSPNTCQPAGGGATYTCPGLSTTNTATYPFKFPNSGKTCSAYQECWDYCKTTPGSGTGDPATCEQYFPGSTYTYTPPSSGNCPAGYHYMGGYGGGSYGGSYGGAGGDASSGGYCMSDKDSNTCQPMGGGATYACTSGDYSAPYIDYGQSSPKAGDTGVPVTAKIHIVFNEEVDPASFGVNQFFSLTEGSYYYGSATTSVSLTGKITTFSNGFDFVPDKPFNAGKTYTWRVLPGIKDKTGNKTYSDYSSTFTTAFSATAGVGSVTGIVTDGKGNTVQNAYVNISNFSYSFYRNQETAVNGSYLFLDIPEGSYRLSLYSPPSRSSLISPSDATVTVAKGVELKKDLTFVTSSKTTKGKVTTATGTVITDAFVSAYRQDGPGSVQTETDVAGSYSLTLSGGTWQINVWPRDYSRAGWSFDQKSSPVTFAFDSTVETKTVDLKVSAQNSKVTGRLVKADGSAPKSYEASVNISSPGGRGYPVSSLNVDGSFSVAVAAGAYEVFVWSSDPAIKVAPRTITVLDNEVKDVGAITLAKTVEKIIGIVTDSSGSPVVGAAVGAYQKQGGGYATAKTDAAGKYSLAVNSGHWTVSAYSDPSSDYVASETPQEVEIPPGGYVTLNIKVDVLNATINGLVKDTGGNLVDDFYGYAYVEGSGVVTSKYSYSAGAPVERGSFTLRVRAGTHRVALNIPSGSGWTTGGSVSATVARGGTAKITLTVRKNTSGITGSLVDEQGKAITGVSLQVFASGSEGAWQEAAVNSSTGQYSLKLSAGTWYLGVTTPYVSFGSLLFGGNDYVMKELNLKVEVSEGRIATQNIVLVSSNAAIKGLVTKPDGSPMSGVWVSVDALSHGTFEGTFLSAAVFKSYNYSTGTQTGKDGSFSVTVPAGTYYVHVYSPPEKGLINPEEQKVTVEGGKTAEVNLAFRSPNTVIKGTVLFEAAPSIAFVSAWSEKGGNAEATAGADGKYTLKVNKEDVWHVAAMGEFKRDYYRSSDAVVKITDEIEFIQDLVLIRQQPIPPPVTTTVLAGSPSVVKVEDGTKISVPANSIASGGNATVTINPDTVLPEQGNAQVVGVGYQVNAFDDKGKAVTDLKTGVTITIPYDPQELVEQGLRPQDLKIAFYDETAAVWKNLEASSVNEKEHTVSATVDHLTRFAIVAAADIVPPSAPGGSVVTTLGNGKIKVTWKNPAKDFSHGKVYRSDKEGILGEVRAAEVFGTEFTDEGVTDGIAYYYTVRAVDPAGNESGNKDQQKIVALGTSAAKKLMVTVGKKTDVKTAKPIVQKKTSKKTKTKSPKKGTSGNKTK